MKFLSYINENETNKDLKLIIDNCKYFFKVNKGHYLYRGMDTSKSFLKKSVRKNRKPLDTELYYHNILNNLFYKHFGWYARSESLFCIDDYNFTMSYGTHTFVIFPIGNFSFIWSPIVKDLYRSIYTILNVKNHSEKDDLIKFENLVKSYQNKNFDKAILSGNEINIKCNEYYAVEYTYFQNNMKLYLDSL